MIRVPADLCLRLSFTFLVATSFCLPAGAATRTAGTLFTISVDKTMWSRWGFQYPATYVFEGSGISPDAAVERRDKGSASWRKLEKKSAGDFFNGVECVRFDRDRARVFVSVGFNTSNCAELKFTGLTAARFVSVAKYYDDRKAACTFSIDNWGRMASANPGAVWHGTDDDRSDNYQAALHVCRGFDLPVSIAINSRMAGSNAMWKVMQQELDRGDYSWEPAVHGQTHPGTARGYSTVGYKQTILGCRDDILQHLHHIPHGQRVFEHILTSGYNDETLLNTDAGAFLFVRGYHGRDHPSSTDYAAWDAARGFYGVGGFQTKDYDTVFRRHEPKGRFSVHDVAELDEAFDKVCETGGIFYGMWHPDRYRNSVIYDRRFGQDGLQGSSLMQHLGHVAHRKDVWYVANGWLYCYRYVAENVSVTGEQSHGQD